MELVALILMIASLGMAIFALGAMAGWTWAVKSRRIRPPTWIIAVLGAAGATSVVAFAFQGNWFSAATTGFLYVLIVAGQLRIGPFRGSGGESS